MTDDYSKALFMPFTTNTAFVKFTSLNTLQCLIIINGEEVFYIVAVIHDGNGAPSIKI